MIVVSDTSPINYLLLIDQIDLLPRLFQQVIIPDVVRDEMLAPSAPPVLQQWIANPPLWLVVQTVSGVDATLNALDPGEQAAITLAQTLPADLLIIDERCSRSTTSFKIQGCVPYCNSHYPTDRLLGTHHAHEFLDINVLIEAVVCGFM